MAGEEAGHVAAPTDKTADKAGKEYWDQIWTSSARLPRPINPHARGFRNFIHRCFHTYFVRLFKGQTTTGQKLLEVGCANSSWLPYFAKEHGFKVVGLDYSELGCRQAEAILHRAEVEGRIICADFFAPPADMKESFDVIISFGVVEHFQDTATCLRNFKEFLKPGGLMITEIPNLAGGIGFLQKHLDRKVYDIHVPLDQKALHAAHEAAGLQVLACNYLIGSHWGVLNFATRSHPVLAKLARYTILALCIMSWLIQQVIPIRPNRLTSPYIICAARKAGGSSRSSTADSGE